MPRLFALGSLELTDVGGTHGDPQLAAQVRPVRTPTGVLAGEGDVECDSEGAGEGDFDGLTELDAEAGAAAGRLEEVPAVG